MAGQYAHIPEVDAQQQAIEKRRRIAEAMLESGQKPVESLGMAGGAPIPISPFQGLASMAKSYFGRKGVDVADEELAKLPEAAQKVADAEMERIQQAQQTQGDGSPTQAVINAMMGSRLPQFQNQGMALQGRQLNSQMEAEQFAQALQQAGIDPANPPEGIDPLSLSPNPAAQELGKARQSAQDKVSSALEIQRQRAQDRKYQIQLMASLRQPPAEQPLQAIIGPDGQPTLVSRRDALGKTPASISSQKPPTDMRYKPDGSGDLEVIPGSKTDVKTKQNVEKTKKEVAVIDRTTDAILTNIDQLIGSEDGKTPEHPGLDGSVGYFDANDFVPPATPAQANAQALIRGLLSKSSVEGLQTIRGSGTAPGSITEKEWPIFQNYLSTLDPKQTKSQFVEQLKAYRNSIKRYKDIVRGSLPDEQEQPDAGWSDL